MKKNKTMAYALAAALLVGGTFLGTKAWFTDKVTVGTELAISTGDLDIVEVQGEKLWTLDRNGAEISDGTTTDVKVGDTLEGQVPDEGDGFNKVETVVDSKKDYVSTELANNLKPGDVLERTVTIKNQGTLVATGLNVTANTVTLEGGLLELGVTGLDKEKLNPGDTATFKLTITVKDKVNGSAHNGNDSLNTDTLEDKVVDLTNAWTLTAIQQGATTQE